MFSSCIVFYCYIQFVVLFYFILFILFYFILFYFCEKNLLATQLHFLYTLHLSDVANLKISHHLCVYVC